LNQRLIAVAISVFIVSGFLGPATAGRSAPPVSEYLGRMGYYVYYDEDSWTTLQREIDHLDIVAPYFFHLTPNGSIKELDERESIVTAFIQSHNKRVIPIIQNEAKWDQFGESMKSATERQRIAENLAELAESKGFDGLQIDFEAVNASDKALLTDFMKAVELEFRPRGLILSQAIVARSSDASTQWGGAYDFDALGKINDFVTIMAYDYNSAGSTKPGSVAPIWWVDEVVGYARQHIPAEKIYLGVPFYGRDWNIDKGPPATSIGFETASRLLVEAKNVVGGFSEVEGSAWFRYEDDDDDRHEVWYENAESLDLKLKLALEHGIAGFAAWRIGQEDPRSWQIIANIETPATPIAPPQSSDEIRYFDLTGHSLQSEFLGYWESQGGLERFGYPRTEVFLEYDPFEQQSYLVQYFERARFEYHPEYAGTPSEVLLGHVGRWALQERSIDPWLTAVQPIEGRRYFQESGHTIGGLFLQYWLANGSLTRFGYPLSEEIVERSPEDGNVYVVQYFERARMEAHTESESGETIVLLGLLGNEMLRDRGWIN
jgi:spore germination protein YaaH